MKISISKCFEKVFGCALELHIVHFLSQTLCIFRKKTVHKMEVHTYAIELLIINELIQTFMCNSPLIFIEVISIN